VVFRHRNRLVSLLLTSASESVGTSPEMLPSEGSLHVASFSAGHHLVFVVSDLSGPDTAQFARALAEPLSRLLVGA